MSADFWAGYLSGAIGIVIGNPLDLLKTRLQAGDTGVHATSLQSWGSTFDKAGTLVRGATAPILGYGALNALLFVSYNRTLLFLQESPSAPSSLTKTFAAGAIGGLATFVVSAPTELLKCRAQVASSTAPTSTASIARAVLRADGLRGFYHGGTVTAIRDSIGYGFYFAGYELSKRVFDSAFPRPPAAPGDGTNAGTGISGQEIAKVLLCGGFAGIITWASIFPLDVVKTRVQTRVRGPPETRGLLGRRPEAGAWAVFGEMYRTEGVAVFYRGLGICSLRAFVVNAVQWAVYEWMMRVFQGRAVASGNIKVG
ncbi:solute carrier family 25 member 45 [Trichodelitschia bisporula]|uniref:Solute carrier family 25 member 45 n=1 Tax=Trichodelitschia bisporula TaxID=703511 RepID=A0A6G1I2H4_9PEZI|nr:solute carrier family 25 member 45 [Trichodelitschia bisporula]